MKTILTVLAGLLGTGLLAYVCATGRRDLIQQDLSDRTRSALTKSAVSDLRVSADGRDVTLLGTVPTPQEKYQAEETARKVYGVWTVTNLLEVRETKVVLASPSLPASPVPEAESTRQQPTVSPPAPVRSPEPQKTTPLRSPPVKEKPAPPQASKAPTKPGSLASLTPPADTRPPPVRCEEALAAVLGRRQIHFEPNSANIRSVSYPVLDRLAEVAKSCPAKKIDISGHTDPSGEERRNVALSRRRAQAVTNYLVKKGVSAKRLAAVGRGSSQPVTSNATETGRQRNRRVEFGIKSP